MSPPKEIKLDNSSESKEKDQTVACKIEVEKEQDLFDAAKSGTVDKIAELLASSECVKTGNLNVLVGSVKNSLTPLQFAAASGQVKCIQMLIQHGADVNAKDQFGTTALHLAAKNGYYMCLKELLKAGAYVNASIKEDHNYFKCFNAPHLNFREEGKTALHLAAKYNRVNCVELLLQFGADCDAVDINGHTSLHIAAKDNLKECVLTLLRRSPSRACLLLPSLDTLDTPLHYAVENRMVECVRELVHLGCDTNPINKYGFSPLHILLVRPIIDADIEILKLLVLEGFNTDINKPTSRGESPLYLAVNAFSNVEIISFLIAYGADVNLENICFRHSSCTSLLEYVLSEPYAHDILTCIVKSMPKLPRLKSVYLDGIEFIDDTIRLVHGVTGTSVVVINDVVDIIYQRLEEQGMIVDHPISRYMKFPLEQPLLDIIYERIIEKLQDVHYTLVDIITSRFPFVVEYEKFLLEMKNRLWYEKIASNPPTLQHCCRYSIRKSIRLSNMRDIKKLQLPEKILSYLLFQSDK